MEFRTKRLILRPWKETDAESLYEYAKDPAVGPIAGWPVHSSVENSLEIIKEVLSADETYAVCLKEDNRAIGSIGLIAPAQAHVQSVGKEMEVGYWIGVPFWGNGYIPEAVKAMQKHAFEDLGCSAMWCGYYDGNEKSKRCQEKCGFKPYRRLVMDTRMGTKEAGVLNLLINPEKNISFVFSHPETLIYKG